MSDTYPIRFADQMREHLRSLRKQRGLTQAQAGALIGVSQARIAEIEAKPGLVSFDQMLQLLSLLGANLSLEVAGTTAHPDNQAVEARPALPGSPPPRKTRNGTLLSSRSGKSENSASRVTERGVNLRKKKGSW